MLRRDDISTVSLLDEPVRRRLYEYVRASREPVGRDEAAGAAGISRSLAAFHMDRLVEVGLLEATYRRLTGRTGRGAGRPAKLYYLSDRRIQVALPQTAYELAGEVLAEAVEERQGGESAEDAVRRVAGRTGRQLGEGARGRTKRSDPLGAARDVVDEIGFRPDRHGDDVLLRDCPFHHLVTRHADLMCAMNHALLCGVLEGLGADGVDAELRFEPGHCCVALTKR